MTIPSPPTDNLYKFIAISGTLILIFSFAFPTHYILKLGEEIADTTAAIATVKMRIKQLEMIKKGTPDYSKQLEKVNDLQAKLINNNIMNEQTIKLLYFLFFQIITGIIMGLALMYYGFSRWYLRVQIHLDEELKNKAKFHAEEKS